LTLKAAVAAAEELKGEFNTIPIDSACGSLGIGLMCREARKLERAGKSIEEIVGYLDKIKYKIRVILTLDTLEYAKMFNKPIIQHAQDLPLTNGGVMNEGFNSTKLGLPGMPAIAENIMVARDIQLSAYTSAQYHVAHISTAGCVDLVRDAKRRGLNVTCEVTPHHFTLTDDAVRSYDTNTKMNPPLRTRDDVEAMKHGLKDGTIDVIATDHAPHSYDEKQVEYQAAPFGIVGLETAIGLAITELFEKNILSLHELIEKFSTNPRRILHLPQIKIQEGEAASLTIFDPSAEWTVDVQKFKSKSKNSPFHGFTLRGKALGVINNGETLLAGFSP
jgi:dihydroorotase